MVKDQLSGITIIKYRILGRYIRINRAQPNLDPRKKQRSEKLRSKILRQNKFSGLRVSQASSLIVPQQAIL